MLQDIIKQDKHLNFGSVICFYDNNGGAGHVAIVEEINSQTGEITCSNSAWQSTFFFLTHITPNAQDKYNWSHYTFQGFIYNPYSDTPIPPTPIKTSKNNWLKAKAKKINIYLNMKGR